MDTATVNVIANHKYDTLKAKMQPAKINHISTFKKLSFLTPDNIKMPKKVPASAYNLMIEFFMISNERAAKLKEMIVTSVECKGKKSTYKLR